MPSSNKKPAKKKSVKPKNMAADESKNPLPATSHNRIRPEKNPSNNPKRKVRQNYYYANQTRLLAQKKQYNLDVKNGTRIPQRRKTPKESDTSKRVIAKKYATEKERKAAKKAQNHAWYERNASEISQRRALEKEKEIEANRKKILDDFNECEKQFWGE